MLSSCEVSCSRTIFSSSLETTGNKEMSRQLVARVESPPLGTGHTAASLKSSGMVEVQRDVLKIIVSDGASSAANVQRI